MWRFLSAMHDHNGILMDTVFLLFIGILGHFHVITILQGDYRNHQLFHGIMPFFITMMGLVGCGLLCSARGGCSDHIINGVFIQEGDHQEHGDLRVGRMRRGGGRGGVSVMSSGLLHIATDALPAGGALGGARFQSWGGRVAATLLVPTGLSLFGTFFLLHEQGTAMKMGVHQFWCLLFLAWAALHVLSKLDGRFTLYVDN